MYDENYALLRATGALASLQPFGIRSFCAKSAQNGFFLMFTDATDRKRSAPNVRKRQCKHTLAPAWLTFYSYFAGSSAAIGISGGFML